MGTFLGIFLTALVVAWTGVNIVRGLWADANEAVQGTTFIGIFTGTGAGLTMSKTRKKANEWRPKIRHLKNTVNSLRRLR